VNCCGTAVVVELEFPAIVLDGALGGVLDDVVDEVLGGELDKELDSVLDDVDVDVDVEMGTGAVFVFADNWLVTCTTVEVDATGVLVIGAVLVLVTNFAV
jgi:hypothetical protein